MSEDEKPMELVRVPRPETVYSREAIFGRDAASVFPSEAQKARQQQTEDLKKAVGLDNSRFITESELEEIKKTRGGTIEDGTVARDKTLAAVLAENKAKKEEAFQQVWKTMKQGKNRPLDEDDLAFVNSLVESESAHERRIREAEKSDLESFQEAVRKAAEQRQQPAGTSGPEPSADTNGPRPAQPQEKPKPVIRVKQKGAPSKRAGTSISAGEAMKRQRAEEETPPDTNDPNALATLISGYASDSESDN